MSKPSVTEAVCSDCGTYRVKNGMYGGRQRYKPHTCATTNPNQDLPTTRLTDEEIALECAWIVRNREANRAEVRLAAMRFVKDYDLVARDAGKSVEDRVEEGLAKIEVAEDSSVLEDD